MKPERAGRYRDELDLIILRAGQAQSWLDEEGPEDFLADDKTKLATYKAFQEAVEASMDVVAMMCKDLGSTPRTTTATWTGLMYSESHQEKS